MGSSGVPGGLCKKKKNKIKTKHVPPKKTERKEKGKIVRGRPIMQLSGLINNARLLLLSLLSHYHSCKNQTVNTVKERRGEESKGKERKRRGVFPMTAIFPVNWAYMLSLLTVCQRSICVNYRL